MKFALKCPICENSIDAQNNAFQGVLINMILTLESKMIMSKENLIVAKKHAISLVENLESQIRNDEILLAQLKTIKEMCGEK